MKRVILIAFTVIFSMSLQAQQGNWLVGGALGFGGTSNTDKSGNDLPKTTSSAWAFAPEVSTFLTNDIQVGLALNLLGTTNKTEGDKTASSSGFSPVIYGRYYMPINDVLSVFSGLNLNFISGSNTLYDTGGNPDDPKTTFSGFGVTADCGVAFAISDRITAFSKFGLLGYMSQTNKNANGDKVDTDVTYGLLVTGMGPAFNVGLYYTFLMAE